MGFENRSMRRVAARGPLVVLMSLIVLACGSTLPEAQQEGAVIGGNEFGSPGASSLPPGARINDKGQVINSEGEVIGSAEDFGINLGGEGGGGTATGNTGRGGGSSVGHGGSGTGDAAANGPGVTDDTIAVGLPTLTGYDAFVASVGASAATGIDERRAWDALVDYQNANGGIAGRRVDPVYHSYNIVSTKTAPQAEQEMCAKWTQDNQVFAALHQPYSSNLIRCIGEAGAVLISNNTWTAQITSIHRQYPFYVEPTTIDLDRGASVMIESLWPRRYFARDARLGLVTFDHPNFRAAKAQGLDPALERHGLELVDAAYLHFPESAQEISQTASDTSNAVLRFKTQGIDHVIFLSTAGGAEYYFMNAAERQDYHPRYGMNGGSGNTIIADALGGDARSQLHGALSSGWIPVADTHAADDPDAQNPARKLCFSIMRKNGVEMTSRVAEWRALGFCDAIWFLAAALDLNPSAINQSEFLRDVDRLGGSFNPAGVFATAVSSSRLDGAGAVADMEFVDSCECFRYTSKPYRVP